MSLWLSLQCFLPSCVTCVPLRSFLYNAWSLGLCCRNHFRVDWGHTRARPSRLARWLVALVTTDSHCHSNLICSSTHEIENREKAPKASTRHPMGSTCHPTRLGSATNWASTGLTTSGLPQSFTNRKVCKIHQKCGSVLGSSTKPKCKWALLPEWSSFRPFIAPARKDWKVLRLSVVAAIAWSPLGQAAHFSARTFNAYGQLDKRSRAQRPVSVRSIGKGRCSSNRWDNRRLPDRFILLLRDHNFTMGSRDDSNWGLINSLY